MGKPYSLQYNTLYHIHSILRKSIFEDLSSSSVDKYTINNLSMKQTDMYNNSWNPHHGHKFTVIQGTNRLQHRQYLSGNFMLIININTRTRSTMNIMILIYTHSHPLKITTAPTEKTKTAYEYDINCTH